MHIDPLIGEYKAQEFIGACVSYLRERLGGAALKTDMREEAFGDDQILFRDFFLSFKVVGIDIDPFTVLSARQRGSDAGYLFEPVIADTRRLPFGGGVFDVILSTSTLDHFLSLKDFEEAVCEFRRTLGGSGCFLLTLNNRRNSIFFWLAKLGRAIGWIPYPMQFFDLKQAEDLCSKAGFLIKEHDYLVHMPMPLNTVFLLLHRFFPSRFVNFLSSIFVCLARKAGSWAWLRSRLGWFLFLACVPVED